MQREDTYQPFGEVAVRLGFCTDGDVTEALELQQEWEENKNEEKLIGMVMLERGMLSTDQLITILRVIQQERDEPQNIDV